MSLRRLKLRELNILGLAISLFILLLVTIGLNEHKEHLSIGSIQNGSRARVQSPKERRLPQAIIIGTRKSGTRALARFLELNPAIRSAQREVHFFDRRDNYRKGLEWYRNQMPPTEANKLTIEKSPAYFVTSGVPEIMKAMNASIKLIVIMRNPVMRLISDFSQLAIKSSSSSSQAVDEHDDELVHVMTGLGTTANDDEAAAVQLANKRRALEQHVTRPDGGIDEQRRIVRTGMYTMHLEKWFAVFPREQFHFVDGERLIVEPHVELQKLERFLGFEQPFIRKEHFVFSPKKGFYCLANDRLARKKRHLDAETIDRSVVCLGKSKGRPHVSISAELKDKLVSFYAPYNDYLLSLTGLNFTANQ